MKAVAASAATKRRWSESSDAPTKKALKKAGVKPWQSWVPYLNSWRLLQLGGQKGW